MSDQLDGHACVHVQGEKQGPLFASEALLAEQLGMAGMPLPTRRVDVDLSTFSRVKGSPLVSLPCSQISPATWSLGCRSLGAWVARLLSVHVCHSSHSVPGRAG